MKNRKKIKFKKRYWLLAIPAAVLVSFVLLLYRPAGYNPLEVGPADDKPKRVSLYLTHELWPQVYDGAQFGEPFDLPVSQKGINEAIARSKWPKESEGVRFSAPVVLFVPDRIVLMGTAVVGGVELVVTIAAEASFDRQGLLSLRVTKVKIGAVNVTFPARVIAKRMYQQRAGRVDIDTEGIEARIAASLLNDEPFEPVFEVEDKKVRVKKVTIVREKLTLHLVPVSN